MNARGLSRSLGAFAGLACAGLIGCGNGGAPTGSGPDAGTDAGQPQPGSTDGGCIARDLATSLGKTTLLVGGTFADTTAAATTWDVRYEYIASSLADGPGPCTSCASNCTAGNSCANSGPGCFWWGCYQYDQIPPGDFASGFAANERKASRIPYVTYYVELYGSKAAEGTAQVAAVNDATFLTRYLNDYRFLAQKLAGGPAFIHIEPDFWGYAEHANADADQVPAKVAASSGGDCPGLPDNIGGLGRCMIAITRKYAPQAKVGLHGSSWGTGIDVTSNNSASLDVAGEAKKLAAFLVKLGAGEGDFVAVDASDRDAGYYQSQGRNTYWDATNATLPNFHQAFAWTKALAEGVGRPVIFWQVPLGNSAQTDTPDHWKDNRVDYFFAHTDELVTANVAGIFFGSGASQMTTPETDGGNFIAKAKAYLAKGGQKLCP